MAVQLPQSARNQLIGRNEGVDGTQVDTYTKVGDLPGRDLQMLGGLLNSKQSAMTSRITHGEVSLSPVSFLSQINLSLMFDES